MNGDWLASAACAEIPAADGTFFPARGHGVAEARRVCATCPVIDECRDDAKAEEGDVHWVHRYGVRAGLTPRQRYAASKADR